MLIKKTATLINVGVTDEEQDKRFELRNIPLNQKTQEMMTIFHMLCVVGFKKKVVVDLPEAWYDHMSFVNRLTLHNEDDFLVFTLFHGDVKREYKVPNKDVTDLFDLSVDLEDYRYADTPVKAVGLERLYRCWNRSGNSEQIMITDKETFVVFVDRYENHDIDSFWHINKSEVFTDCALMDKAVLNKLFSVFPEDLMKALAGNVFDEEIRNSID